MATYRSYGACRTELGASWPSLRHIGAVCWQPTSLLGPIGLGLGHIGLYVDLQVLGVCWTELGAVCWQASLVGAVGPSLGNLRLYVGKLGPRDPEMSVESGERAEVPVSVCSPGLGELLTIHMLQTSSCYSDDCSHWWCQGFLMTCPCTNLHVRS